MKSVLLILTFLIGFTPVFSSMNLKVSRKVLKNGLRVLIHKNTQAPLIACRLFYVTGSVHEHPGESGIAHMLEHMLFKGTKRIGITDSVLDAVFIQKLDSIHALEEMAKEKGDSTRYAQEKINFRKVLDEHRKLFIKDELWELYKKEGGTGLNAFTADLMTAYHVTLPKNKLELFLWLESDRMQNAVLREFYSERDVVHEERRMRYDDSPSGRYFEGLNAMFYEAFPYRIPTIGWPSDIEHLTRAKAEKHYRNYYKPNNAILVLAGNIDEKKAMPLIEKYFGSIPRGKEFEPITIRDPKQTFEKRLIQHKADAKPRLDLWFHTPGIPDSDLYALDVVEGVLSGKTGRLYKRFVEKENIAIGANAGNGADKYTSMFWIDVNLKENTQHEKVEQILWEELNRLKHEKISPHELQKVKNQVYANSVRHLQGMENIATRLAYFEMYGDWNLINSFPESVSKVTAEDVLKVCQKYFVKENSTTGMQLPPEKSDSAMEASK